ncbi:MAG: hypothetical protein ACK4RK_12520 [Gemmataceae bacterium]
MKPTSANQKPVSVANPVLLAVLISASGVILAAAEPLALIQRGNLAFAEGDYATALELYEQAGEWADDPGWIAFNQGAVHYRQENYREAEQLYRACLEDATGSRRARALYNLGNCLLRQGGDTQPEVLRHAIDCFQQCQAHPASTPELREEARHNLELAKLLWVKAKAAQAKDPPHSPNSGESDPSDTKSPQPPPKNGTDSGTQPANGNQSPQVGEPVTHPQEQPRPMASDHQPPPGQGTLPIVPDTENVVPLPAADTAALLQQAAADILEEIRKHRLIRSATQHTNPLDW